MSKYCKFLRNVYFEDKVIFRKDEEYLITYKDNKNYYFCEPRIENAVEKILENKIFVVIERK